MAIRRSAIERVGRFDERRELYGDEQEWQARWRAPGGRIRYVAAAALDHRRAGDDARLRSLPARPTRAARPAGASTPSEGPRRRSRRELRVLAGCAAHGPRFALRERPGHDGAQRRAPARALAGAPRGAARPATTPTTSSPGHSGTVGGRRGTLRASPTRARRPRGAPRRRAGWRRGRRARPRRRVLVLGVDRPEVPGLMARRCAELERSAATTSPSTSPTAGGRGKFENLNALLAEPRPGRLRLAAGRRRRRRAAAAASSTASCTPRKAGLRLAQPAHRLHSHAAWAVTRRRPGRRPRARRPSWRSARSPPSTATRSRRCCRSPRCAWAGASTCTGRRWRRERGWPIGVVDATPGGPHAAPGGRRLPARGGGRRGAALPRRAAVRPPRRGAHARGAPVKVAIVAEFYPRADDPVLGVWAHRQALAARDAGADVRVRRAAPPDPARGRRRRGRLPAETRGWPPSRARAELDGIEVRYVRFVAPPRPRSYGSWGAWAAPTLAVALRRLRRTFPFDLVHAHNAVPAGEAVRARLDAPLVVSVHGGDVFFTARATRGAPRDRAAAFAAARLVLANSAGIERRAASWARRARAWCAWAPTCRASGPGAPARRRRRWSPSGTSSAASATPTCCARWRCCATARPTLRYVVVGDGPERAGAGPPGRRAGPGRPRRARRPARPRRGARARAGAATSS